MDETALIEALKSLPTSTLHEVMDKSNTLWPSIRPLWRPLCLCGPAFTVKGRPGDNLAAHWALAVAPAGSVLVITTEGDTQCGGWGEIDLPFYETGTVKKALPGEDDIQIIMQFLRSLRPHQIYAAGD